MIKGLKFHFDNEYVTEPVRCGPILLWQIGDIGCKSGYIVKEHKQYCYEITCVAGGKGIISANREKFLIEKNQLFLNKKNELHKIESDLTDPIRYCYIGFDFDENILDSTWSRIKNSFQQCEKPLATDNVDLNTVFQNAFNEMMTKDNISQEMISFYVQQILMLSYRALMLNKSKQYVQDDNENLTQSIVYSVINYIDTNVCGIEKLDDIAKQVGYSYAHVARLFKNSVGKSLGEYYTEKRFDKATQLLKEDLQAQEIAELLNYKTLSSFSRAFGQHFGMTISEYKDKHITKDNNNNL